MGILFWRKNNDKIDAFAKLAADELYSYVRPEEAAGHFAGKTESKKKRQRNIENRITAVIIQMHNFGKENSLGIYGKARLQQQFNDRLIELGYDKDVSKKLEKAILYQGIS